MKRILTAALLILVVVLLIFRGQPWMLTLACALVAELAAYEYLRLANTSGTEIPIWWMLSATALVFLFTLPNFHNEAELPALSLMALLLLAWSGFRAPIERVLADASLGLFGLIYVAYPLTLIPLIWKRDDGQALLLFLMVTVWSGDIAALYVGRRWGKHKLTRLSPNKTWEGTFASIAGSIIAGLAVVLAGELLATHYDNTILHIVEPVWQSILLAAVLNAAAQLGDLLESAIKRGAGVKDSGTLLPGHGGILDRIDALLLAAPVLWCVLLLKDALSLVRF